VAATAVTGHQVQRARADGGRCGGDRERPAPAQEQRRGTDGDGGAQDGRGGRVAMARGQGSAAGAVDELATLERTGPRRITDLAIVQGISQPAMTTLVGVLETTGYVERRGDDSDRRVTLLRLTEAGARALDDRRRAGAESITALIDKLRDDEIALLTAALPVLQQLRRLGDEDREPG
jgi:DNA-binding MarR family transcriptional regulator